MKISERATNMNRNATSDTPAPLDCLVIPSLFSCIVADPPWDHSDGTGFSFGHRDPRGRSGKHGPCNHSLPYSVMTVDQIAGLPVKNISSRDAMLYLWTTNRFLESAYSVVRAWGFKPGAVLVWCKPAKQGLFGGTFLSNVEFIVTAKRGSPRAMGKAGSRWYEWPRGKHSKKPEAFQDMVETISPGPYLELFARRKRPGWQSWGDEVMSDIVFGV